MPKFLKLILIVFLFFSCSQKPHKDYFGDDFPSHVNDMVLIINSQCLGYDWNQCFELGHFYYQGIKGVPVNQQKAKLLWEESCSHDHQKSCDDYNKFFSSTRVQHQLKELMKEPEKVLELSLVRSNLNEIPKEVFEMINLENLNLIENNIKIIPSEIKKLKKLKMLSLDRNPIQTISPDIKELIQLDKISLNEVCLEKENLEILSLLPHLRSLWLGRCYYRLPKEITLFQNLQELDLSGINLSAGTKDDLNDQYNFQLLSNIKKLKTLNYSGRAMKVLPQEIGLLTQLENLQLRHNSIQNIPIEIKKLIHLRKISIEFDIVDNQNKEILLPIFNLEKLQELDLSGKFNYIPDNFDQLLELKKLKISSYRLSNVPESISSLKKLNTLSFANSNLASLPKTIQFLPNLMSLDLAYNKKLADFIDQLLAEKWFSETLTELYLDGLQLNQKKYLQNLSQYKNLVKLSLSSNNLKEVPEFINQLDRLEYLDLSKNNISQWPDWLEKKSLKNFIVTEITNSIPDESFLVIS